MVSYQPNSLSNFGVLKSHERLYIKLEIITSENHNKKNSEMSTSVPQCAPLLFHNPRIPTRCRKPGVGVKNVKNVEVTGAHISNFGSYFRIRDFGR